MSDHTPGPWTVGDKPGVWVGPVITANSGKKGIAFVVGQTDSGWLGGYETSVGEDRTNANARLLAAAPDLLVGLKRLVQYSDEYPTGGYHMNDVIRQCRAVIAQVEGRVD